MITRDTALSVEWLAVGRGVIDPDFHHEPLDRGQVMRYLALLDDDPAGATDPILVERRADDTYLIKRGRHRYLASWLAGRRQIAAIVVEEI